MAEVIRAAFQPKYAGRSQALNAHGGSREEQRIGFDFFVVHVVIEAAAWRILARRYEIDLTAVGGEGLAVRIAVRPSLAVEIDECAAAPLETRNVAVDADMHYRSRRGLDLADLAERNLAGKTGEMESAWDQACERCIGGARQD